MINRLREHIQFTQGGMVKGFILFFLCLFSFVTLSFASYINVVTSTSNNLVIDVSLPEVELIEREYSDGNTYSILVVPGGGKLDVGKPDVPGFGSWILVPNGTEVDISSYPGEPIIYENISLPPVQPPFMDFSNTPEPSFIKDGTIYSKDANYPNVFAETEPIKNMRGQSCTILWIYPYQYNPVKKILKVYPDLRVDVKFTGVIKPIPYNLKSNIYNTIMHRMAINAETILDAEESAEIFWQDERSRTDGCELLIITHIDFSNAANTLADWKQKRGISAKVREFTSGTTTDAIKDTIDSAMTWTPAPEYLLIIGDAEYIPTWYENLHPEHGSPYFQGHTGTDIFYADTDEPPDYVADLSYGRLSVDTESQADSLVDRIIRYERNPTSVSSFYTNATMAACFQDGNQSTLDSIADRRFAKTSEDVKNYLATQGYTTERIYTTYNGYNSDEVFPKYWNDQSWAVFENDTPGQEIPAYLQKPTFPWDGSTADVTSAVNDGRFFVLHRDHGSRNGWAHPSFYEANVDALNNGEKRPVVWTINCETGWFDNETDDTECGTSTNDECFVEHWHRHNTGGSCGLIGATRISYSGYNDRLVWGWMDAIWPGFLTWCGVTYPDNDPIYNMGTVVNYGKEYMMTYFSNNSTRRTALEEFQWHGDPTMEMWTGVPDTLTVTHDSTILLGATSCSVRVTHSGLGVESTLVCLLKENDVYETDYTNASGNVTLTLSPSPASIGTLYVTVSKHNYLPYEGEILVCSTYIEVSPDTLMFSCVNFTLKNLLEQNSSPNLLSSLLDYNTLDANLSGTGFVKRRISTVYKTNIGLNSDINKRLSQNNFLSEVSRTDEPSNNRTSLKYLDDGEYLNLLYGRLPEDTIHFDGPYSNNAIGLTGGGTYEAGIRITPTELTGYNNWLITSLLFYHHETTTHSCTVKVYAAGTDTTPGALITQQPYSASDSGWHRIDLLNPVTLNSSQDIWASIEVTHATGEHPIGVDAGPAVDGKGDWVYFGGAWSELQDIPLDYNWNVRTIISSGDTVKTMLVRNTGSVNLNVDSIIPSETWINNISPTLFTVLPGDSQGVTVTVTRDALGNGTHYANLSIYCDDPYGNPYIEPIKFVINSASAAPDIFVTPDTINFSYSKDMASEPNFIEPNNDKPGLSFSTHSKENINTFLRSPDDTIYYDDGAAHWAYQGASSALYWAVKFTPSQSCTIKAGMVMNYIYMGTAPTCSLFVWDDAGGQPGTMVAGPFIFTAGNTFVTVPITTEYTDANDFWVGYYLPWYSPGDTTYALTDVSSEHGTRQGISANRISWTVNPGFSGDQMIRAIVSYEAASDTVKTMVVHNNGNANLNASNITGSETWIIDISPTLFLIPQGDSQNVTVTVTKNGLANGTHHAFLSIYSNDPDENPYTETVKFVVSGGTGITEENILPEVFYLSRNKPNPFSHTTWIEFGLPIDTYVNMTIYNLSGQKIATLINEKKMAGYYEISWDGVNDRGMKVSPGIYFCRIETKRFRSTRKTILLR